MRLPVPLLAALVLVPLAATRAGASDPVATPGYHPWAPPRTGHVRTIDLSPAARAKGNSVMDLSVPQPDLHALEQFKSPDAAFDLPYEEPPPRDPSYTGRAPDGWVQAGNVILPKEIVSGDALVDPDVIAAVEDIPGNEYPRKHTLYLNFLGGMLYAGMDNSAEDKSIIAKQGLYPAFTGGEQKAISAAQAIENDVATYGVRVAYIERPDKIVPYTMEMIGGNWMDVNTDSPAGGVAPGADCGALGQRHVVYTFAGGGASATQIANTASQEAGHAWGLDHTFNCSSVMSYCGFSDGVFSSTCDGLCEATCQGENTAGCRLTHENFCGVGNDQQNEREELSWLFGGNEPDVEPPFAEIVSPTDGEMLEVGANVDLRAEIGDNYGGYGWQWTVTRNDEVIFDEVIYDRGDNIDTEYRPALNVTQLDEGVWVMTIKVQDQFENVTEDTVTVIVGDPEVPMDTGDDTGGGTTPTTMSAGDSADDDGSGGATDDPMLDDGGLDDGGGKGCGCQSAGGGGAGSAFAAFVLVAAAARRRRRC
jgi:MYXO-CTERM domain-containing protein